MTKPSWLQKTDPVPALDRWLLQRLGVLGTATAQDFAESSLTQAAGGQPALTVDELDVWLRSADRRGLLEVRTVDVEGNVLRPPLLALSETGRARLASARPFSAHLPGPLGSLYHRLFPDHHAWRDAVTAFRSEDPLLSDWSPSSDPKKLTAHKPAADAASKDNLLEKIDHIVVLMLENRSFDHMLGYLRLQGQIEVNGLTGTAEQVNRYQEQAYFPKRLGQTRIPKNEDPCHSIRCVAEQLKDDNGGFVRNFATEVDADYPGLVMGYYTGDELPAYDYLAHNYCLCDSWHSSIPGSTWPNRLFSITSQADLEHEGVTDGPLWDFPSFTRHLKPEEWRWYSHDPATLRVVDSQYRPGTDGFNLHRDNFRFFDRKTVSDFTKLAEELIVDEHDSFLDDVRHGQLRGVSWIDPNFIDLSVFERNSNDDHPPSDVRAGQRLVLNVFRALVEGPPKQWEKTLLVIAYDEHGGFYDHVVPPETGDPDPFQRYGVRVPALIVSPWIEPGTVSHTLFDHTSLIKTILLRFNEAAIDQMPPRVCRAAHLGTLLTGSAPAPVPDYRHAINTIANWHSDAAAQASASSPLPADNPPPLKGFTAEMMWAAQQLRKQGLDAGHP